MAKHTSRRSPSARKSDRSGSISVFAAVSAAVAAILFGLFSITPVDGSAPAPARPDRMPTPVAAGDVAGTASVIDGDTLDIHGERIRLSGIDAPESGQKCRNAAGALWRCGADAANALDAFISGNPVSCAYVDTDRYGRSVSVCSVRGADMQHWLAVNGYALAYRQYSTAYVSAENQARAAKAGIWAGEFVNPADWRKGQRLSGEPPTKAMREGKIASR